jgi:hypothetical protein
MLCYLDDVQGRSARGVGSIGSVWLPNGGIQGTFGQHSGNIQ